MNLIELFIGIHLIISNGIVNNLQIFLKFKKNKNKIIKDQIELDRDKKREKKKKRSKNKSKNKDKDKSKSKRTIKMLISNNKCNNKIMEIFQHVAIWHLAKSSIYYIYLVGRITKISVITSYSCLICKSINGKLHYQPILHNQESLLI
jgi:hypothetical protein